MKQAFSVSMGPAEISCWLQQCFHNPAFKKSGVCQKKSPKINLKITILISFFDLLSEPFECNHEG